MQIEISSLNGIATIRVEGEIDLFSSHELRAALMGLVNRKTSPIVVDLSLVTYIDSSGIATFVEGLKVMMRYQGSLRLAGISDRIMEIFTFSKLDRVFEIYRSADDALSR